MAKLYFLVFIVFIVIIINTAINILFLYTIYKIECIMIIINKLINYNGINFRSVKN